MIFVNDMDVQQLRTFYRVAKRGSVTAAAQELGYTQSAVSRQIAALEASIDARLFDRRARGVRLTEHGQCLLPHAESLLERLDAARRDLAELDNLERGRLRVGAFATANAALIPQALAAFRRQHPSISLSLVEGSTHRQLAWLEAGEVDVAVVSAFPDQRVGDDRIDLVRLLDDAMLVAVPRSHHLARRRRLRLRELAHETWIAADSRENDRLLGPERLRTEYEPVVDFVVREWTAKLGFVAAGLGITLVPSLAARAAPADVALVALHPEERSFRRIYAAATKGRVRSPAADAFLAILRDSATLIRRSPAGQ
jgi:DNA-binding transcriptional LysR family regulator